MTDTLGVRRRVGSGPVGLRGKRMPASIRGISLRLGGIFSVLAVLEIFGRSGVIQSGYLPPVTEIYAELLRRMTTAAFWETVGQTLQGWGIGLVIAVVLAVPLGVLIGSFDPIHRLTRGTVEFFRPIPSVAILPAVVLFFGSTLDTKVFLVAFATFWPILAQTVYGVHDTDPVAQDAARSYGLGRFARFRTITLPSAAPYIATGLRISSSIGLVLSITTEIVVGVPGLGSAITSAQSGGSYSGVYALILAAGLLGWALNGVVRTAEARSLHWHESFRNAQ